MARVVSVAHSLADCETGSMRMGMISRLLDSELGFEHAGPFRYRLNRTRVHTGKKANTFSPEASIGS